MLRPYRPADLADVLAAWAAASRLAHDFLDAAFLAEERERLARQWLPSSDTTVATGPGGGVVGFVSLVGAEVGGLFVHPDHHRRGIGRALMDHAVATVEGAVELDVFDANMIGRAFYRTYGFVEVGRGVDEGTGLPVRRLRYTP